MTRDDIIRMACEAGFEEGWVEVCNVFDELTRFAELVAAAEPKPIDMLLYCPACGVQHIDEPDGIGNEHAGLDESVSRWDNPPHRSHLCYTCGHIWRPADVLTNGVAAIETRGQNDSPAVEPTAEDELPGMWEQADLEGGETDCAPQPAIRDGVRGEAPVHAAFRILGAAQGGKESIAFLRGAEWAASDAAARIANLEAESAGKDARIAELQRRLESHEAAFLKVRKALCGDINNEENLLDLIAGHHAQLAAANERLEAAEEALIWYGDEAAAIKKNLAEAKDQALMASVHILALDGGKRAALANRQTRLASERSDPRPPA